MNQIKDNDAVYGAVDVAVQEAMHRTLDEIVDVDAAAGFYIYLGVYWSVYWSVYRTVDESVSNALFRIAYGP